MSLLNIDMVAMPARGHVTSADVDAALTAQLVVAWAGEGGEESRLGWWRSDLVSEFGGEDLFRRLLPSTWAWAVLQAARETARRKDAELRRQDHDPDRILSLFSLGFELDERIDERLQDLKRGRRARSEALPGLGDHRALGSRAVLGLGQRPRRADTAAARRRAAAQRQSACRRSTSWCAGWLPPRSGCRQPIRCRTIGGPLTDAPREATRGAHPPSKCALEVERLPRLLGPRRGATVRATRAAGLRRVLVRRTQPGRVKVLLTNMRARFDAFPPALAVLHRWPAHVAGHTPGYLPLAPAALRPALPRVHRRLPGRAARRAARPRSPATWSSAGSAQQGPGGGRCRRAFSSPASCSPRPTRPAWSRRNRDPRPLVVPRVADDALAYLMYLLRERAVRGHAARQSLPRFGRPRRAASSRNACAACRGSTSSGRATWSTSAGATPTSRAWADADLGAAEHGQPEAHVTCRCFQQTSLQEAFAALRRDLIHEDGPRISTMRNYRFAILQYCPATSSSCAARCSA